jgi:hypothetical protein
VKRVFFKKHAKSSAAIISLSIHGMLLLIAVSFVAVTVITKEDQNFEAKPLNRPKMQLKKLQVPVNIKKKKTQKPKLRKRIVVKPKLNQAVPDIKMPEITGVKGGLGNAGGDGIGGSGGIGFSMPEIELFGTKGKGEKIFIILDASPEMMVDQMGGITSYEIIKAELIRILGELNPSVLFNVAVYSGRWGSLCFPSMVSASSANVSKASQWLKPLNGVAENMRDDQYGLKTLGPGGISLKVDTNADPIKGDRIGYWVKPAMKAMESQADLVFVLTCNWGRYAHFISGGSLPKNFDMERYKQKVAEARAKLKKENDRRREKGVPPRVIAGGEKGLVRTYFPGEPVPSYGGEAIKFGPEDILEGLKIKYAMHRQNVAHTASGIQRKSKKDNFSINMIQFVRSDSNASRDSRYKMITSKTKGDHKIIKGLDAIRSFAEAEAKP